MPTSGTSPAPPLPPPDPRKVRAEASALFLDLDGTLAAFRRQPGLVGPDPERTRRLRALNVALDGRLAILSGRTLEDIDRILEGSVVAAAGVHGLERRASDGAVTRRPAHPAIETAADALARFAAAHPGVAVEPKGPSVALHYRAAPEAADMAQALVRRLAESLGLTVQMGALVAELRTPGADKGDALLAFMSEAGFNGAHPVMIGDDLTDEAAFEVAAGLGGFGILVGDPRPTAAAFGLRDVQAVHAFLDQILAVDGPGPRRPPLDAEAPCPV